MRGVVSFKRNAVAGLIDAYSIPPMTNDHPPYTIAMLINPGNGPTAWTERAWPAEVRGGMVLSPRIGCSSLRLRLSEAGYATHWHVAGDATLIVIRKGVLRVELREGEPRDFSAGDAFIAADRLDTDIAFDEAVHGHRAQVVGDEALEAVHIKLDGFEA